MAKRISGTREWASSNAKELKCSKTLIRQRLQSLPDDFDERMRHMPILKNNN